jgi:heme/copper-type cytochrome/quinol oxidase subunit 2
MKLKSARLVVIVTTALALIVGGNAFTEAAIAASVKTDTLKISATGDGAKWVFVYDKFGFQSSELNLPTNQKVEINISMTGVSDALWIPQMGVKVDATPFQNVTTQINTSKPRKFSIMSINLCDQHNKHMVIGNGKVVTTSSFESWVKKQGGRLA